MRPTILWIHPGGLITGSKDWLSSEQAILYLEAGYTLVSIDHRLAPEYKLETIVEDIEDAYAWARTEGPGLFRIDPDRIAIVGHSAGGYLALIAGYRLEQQPRALISFYGYGDITGGWATQPSSYYSDRPSILAEQANEAIGAPGGSCIPQESELDRRFDFYIYARQQGIWSQEISGHDPEQNPEWFAAYEPLQNLSITYPPTVLLHGEMDTDVPFEQSLLMAEALGNHGIENEWISNPAWGHVFDQEGLGDPGVRDAFEKVIAFLDTHNR